MRPQLLSAENCRLPDTPSKNFLGCAVRQQVAGALGERVGPPLVTNAAAGAGLDIWIVVFRATSEVAESAALKRWRCELEATE